jgi:ABC-type phosphate/phosphonate transport system substrate-binding protein
MFTARVGLDVAIANRFRDALLGMRWDNPAHRPVLEAEGLKQWLAAKTDGYTSLRDAAQAQGFFDRSRFNTA